MLLPQAVLPQGNADDKCEHRHGKGASVWFWLLIKNFWGMEHLPSQSPIQYVTCVYNISYQHLIMTHQFWMERDFHHPTDLVPRS